MFPPDFTQHLRKRIEGQVEEEAPVVEEAPAVVEEPTPAPVSRFKTSSFKPTDELVEPPKTTIVQDDGGESPMAMESDVDGQPLDDIDGEPLESIDGEPMDGIDGTRLDDDIDGAPLEDDVDGAPLDDEIDGAPMEDIDGEVMV